MRRMPILGNYADPHCPILSDAMHIIIITVITLLIIGINRTFYSFVLSYSTRPLNKSKAGDDPAFIQTSLLFSYK